MFSFRGYRKQVKDGVWFSDLSEILFLSLVSRFIGLFAVLVIPPTALFNGYARC
jgi:hypothetical protein